MSSGSLADLALTIPWCITPDALEVILSIAERAPLDEEEIKRRMHGPKSLALRDGQPRSDSERTVLRDGVALIPIDGPIYRYADYFTKVSGGVTTESLARDFQAALDDPSVGAILFVIDSPGGEGTGINELSDAIYAARGQKPIAAYIEGYGASAAYWIASAAGEVVIDDSALVGSIGTVLAMPDPSKRFTRSIEIVSTQSPKKRPDVTTPEGRAVIQQIADSLTDVFIAKVARNRNVAPGMVLSDFGEGGLLIGQAAVTAGMADRLGSEEQIVRELGARAQRRRPFPVRMPGGPMMYQEESMKVSQFIAGIFTGAQEAGIELEADAPSSTAVGELLVTGTTTTTTAAVEPPPPSAEQLSREQRLVELERQLAAQKQAQIAQAATTFADKAVRDRRAFPAERSALIALYTQAAQDDDRVGAADGQIGRVAHVEQLIAARPQHSLSSELIASGPGGVLEQSAGPKEMTEERRRALLAMTPLGQAVIKTARSA